MTDHEDTNLEQDQKLEQTADAEAAAVQTAQDEQLPDMPLVGTIEETRFGKLKYISITSEMEKSYLDYAMSVIVSRALPDVRDGLKPVHRRILYSMYRSGTHHTSAYRKSATTVGNVLG